MYEDTNKPGLEETQWNKIRTLVRQKETVLSQLPNGFHVPALKYWPTGA